MRTTLTWVDEVSPVRVLSEVPEPQISRRATAPRLAGSVSMLERPRHLLRNVLKPDAPARGEVGTAFADPRRKNSGWFSRR